METSEQEPKQRDNRIDILQKGVREAVLEDRDTAENNRLRVFEATLEELRGRVNDLGGDVVNATRELERIRSQAITGDDSEEYYISLLRNLDGINESLVELRKSPEKIEL